MAVSASSAQSLARGVRGVGAGSAGRDDPSSTPAGPARAGGTYGAVASPFGPSDFPRRRHLLCHRGRARATPKRT
jgi:hypothetical protein